MADVTGQRNTGNIEQAQRAIDMSKVISLLEPNKQPLQVLTRQLTDEPATSPKFSWMEDESEARFDNFAANKLAADTVLTVADGTKFTEHQIIQNTATQENMLVTGVAGDDITVERGKGGAAAAVTNGDEILIIGIAQPEGDDVRVARSSNPDVVFNYTGIDRTPFSASRTLIDSDFTHNPGDWEHQSRKAGIEHVKDLEQHKLYGKKFEDLGGAKPRRGTGGVVSFINTNVTDANGQLSQPEFNIGLRKSARYSGFKAKLGLASPVAVTALNNFPLSNLVWQQSEDTFGINVARFVTPHGILNLVNHWLLDGAEYGGYLIVLDMEEVRRKVFRNADTHIRQNIQNPGVDGRTDEYLTEDGLKLGQEKKHGLFVGITD